MYDEYFQLTPLRQKLQFAASRKTMAALLNAVPELELVEMVDDEAKVVDVLTVWYEFVRYDASFFAQVSLDAPQHEIENWLINCLQELGMEQTYFISIGGLANLPWIKVKTDSRGVWLARLYATGEVPALMILSPDGERALGFVRAEDDLLTIKEAVSKIIQNRASRTD